MSKINVMYIFNDTSFGGAGQSLLDTLVDIGEEINPIVVIRESKEVKDKFAELGIRCCQIDFSVDYVKMGNVSEDLKKKDLRRSYKAALQLIPIIKEEEIQLIHINSSISYFGAIAALMAGIPYIWHIRELMEEHYGYEFLNKELRAELYKRAERVISISDFVQKYFSVRFGIDTVKIYNGLNIKRFKNQIEDKKEYKNIFLAAGRITPPKGQWDIVRATKLLLKNGSSNVIVIIAGGGNDGYVWALKKYIVKNNLDKNIFIMPHQQDLSRLRRYASYAITSSRDEALGRVTVEAMLAGNVVLGARSGGTVEIIGEKEERGFLYEWGNAEDLAKTMVRAMECPAATKNGILRKSQSYAEDTFDSVRYCKNLLQLYYDAAEGFKYQNHENFLDQLDAFYQSTDSIEEYKDNINPYKKSADAYGLALSWLEIRQQGRCLEEYFKKHFIQSIAIYGMAALGCRLYDELEDSEIDVRYMIDRNPDGMEQVFNFVSLDNQKIDVDAIVVTVVSSEKQIIQDIKRRGYKKVIGLSEVLSSLMVFYNV